MASPDEHLNVFYAYRGPQPKNADGEESGQLENNVTHALIVTLKNLPEAAQRQLLQQWVGEQLQGYETSAPEPLKFLLQTSVDAERDRLHNRNRVWLLGISVDGKEEEGKDSYGTRPDAWVFGPGWAIVIEVKTGDGKLIRQQLDSYQSRIERHAGSNSVKRLCKSWGRDIAPALESLSMGQQDSGPGGFLLSELRGYLEMEGLGTASFTRQDFVAWDDRTSTLKNKIGGLGKALVDHLGNHWLNWQQEEQDYIGMNLVHDSFKGKQPYTVPHWSLGLERHGRRLRLFVQCEGAPLSQRLVRRRRQVEGSLAQSLQTAKGDPRLQLRVEEKWFVMQKGRNERAPVYPVCFASPLRTWQSEESVRDAVRAAFNSMQTINSTENRQRIKNIGYLSRYKGRAIVGVLQLEFCLNWFELEELGGAVGNELLAAATRMNGYYEQLLNFSTQPTAEHY